MSAAILRQSATLMRDDWQTEHADPEEATFYLAVADWLEESAAELDERQRTIDGLLVGIGSDSRVSIDAAALEPAALTVAHAYLGGNQ